MIIREANASDLPAILQVLKASLGETSSRKTEQVWNYKHVRNPFGESLVLVACDKDRIIGVRAFMKWKWKKENTVFDAYRAVDTATHPDFQGRGVFKKLTLEALSKAKSLKDHFVFNTPNSQSKPGYLKLGWKEVGQLKPSIKLTNPFNFFSSKEKVLNYHHEICAVEDLASLLKQYNLRLSESDKLYTPKTVEYLRWRYEQNVLQDYFVYSSEQFYVAGYLKKRGRANELRITELIYNSSKGKKETKQLISQLAAKFRANFISYHTVEKLFHTEIRGKFGPVLTFKPIVLEEEIKNYLLKLDSWQYSLGDLELF